RFILLGEELLQLPEQFARLTTVVERLVEAVKRLEQTQQEMLGVQQQHTQAIQQLQETQQEILEVQQQHTREIRETRQYMERVANAYGLTLEGEAEDALEYMARKKGWKFLKPPQPLRSDIELDLIAVCEDAQGQPFTVIVEVKARLAQRTVREWANRIRAESFRNRLAELGYPAPYRMYIMGFRIDPQAEEAARELRVGLFDPRGERVEPEPLTI
ncbi:MAG: hypothetical protein SNJ72_11325, partial [Fimbriimonadales bacterium]